MVATVSCQVEPVTATQAAMIAATVECVGRRELPTQKRAGTSTGVNHVVG